MNGSTLRLSLGSIQSSGWNLPSSAGPRGIRPATWQGRSSTLKSVTRPMPLLPATMLDQVVSAPQPSGVTMPTPVMTTRLTVRRPRHGPVAYRACANQSGGVLFKEANRVADGEDRLGCIIGDLDAELLL